MSITIVGIITAAIISVAGLISTVLILRAAEKKRVLAAAEKQKERDFMLQMLAASKASSAVEAVQAAAVINTFEQTKKEISAALEPKTLAELEAALPQEREVNGRRYELVTMDSLR